MTETATKLTPARPQQHAAQVASIDAIRAQFPALDRKQSGTPVAYFDGPGGTQVPKSVVEAVTTIFTTTTPTRIGTTHQR